LPIYQYRCRKCGNEFERLEKVSSLSWETLKTEAIYCSKCKAKEAFRIPSLFKLGSKILETVGKSGYETDDFTLGKLIDEGGIPYEERNRLKNREEMIKRQKKYTKELNRRAKKYKFNPTVDD
jgi:putative FmdB family regulatory protein